MEAANQKEWPLLLDAFSLFFMHVQLFFSSGQESRCDYLRDLSKKRREIFQSAHTFLISHTRTNTFLSIFTSSLKLEILYFISFHFLSPLSSQQPNTIFHFRDIGAFSINTRRVEKEEEGFRDSQSHASFIRRLISDEFSQKDLQDTRSRRESAGDVTHSHCESRAELCLIASPRALEYSTAQLEARYFFFCLHNQSIVDRRRWGRRRRNPASVR